MKKLFVICIMFFYCLEINYINCSNKFIIDYRAEEKLFPELSCNTHEGLISQGKMLRLWTNSDLAMFINKESCNKPKKECKDKTVEELIDRQDKELRRKFKLLANMPISYLPTLEQKSNNIATDDRYYRSSIKRGKTESVKLLF